MKTIFRIIPVAVFGLLAVAVSGCRKEEKVEPVAPAKIEEKVTDKAAEAKPAETPETQKPKDHPAH